MYYGVLDVLNLNFKLKNDLIFCVNKIFYFYYVVFKWFNLFLVLFMLIWFDIFLNINNVLLNVCFILEGYDVW